MTFADCDDCSPCDGCDGDPQECDDCDRDHDCDDCDLAPTDRDREDRKRKETANLREAVGSRAWKVVRDTDHEFVGNLQWGKPYDRTDSVFMRCVLCGMEVCVNPWNVSWIVSYDGSNGGGHGDRLPSCVEITGAIASEVMES